MQDINELIEANKRLVYAQLHRFKLIDDPDAESLAYEALYNAISNFDASKGNKLSTVATVYIYNALGTYLRKLNSKRQVQAISYNIPIDDENNSELIDLISSHDNIEEEYIRKEMSRTAMHTFNTMYDKLTNEKHKQILRIWKESDFSCKYTEIASIANVSQSYVSQVINNFKYTLRKKLEDMYND